MPSVRVTLQVDVDGVPVITPLLRRMQTDQFAELGTFVLASGAAVTIPGLATLATAKRFILITADQAITVVPGTGTVPIALNAGGFFCVTDATFASVNSTTVQYSGAGTANVQVLYAG